MQPPSSSLGGIFHFLFANSGEPDQTPHIAASDLVLHYLPMSYKKDARRIWVKARLHKYNLV